MWTWFKNLNPDTLADYATTAGFFTAMLLLFLGYFQLRSQRKQGRFNVIGTSVIQFYERYERMAQRRHDLKLRLQAGESVPDREVLEFYYRYWALQVDQWEYFRLGLVPTEVYGRWMLYVVDALRGQHSLTLSSGENVDTWKLGGWLTRHHTKFRSFIEELRGVAADYPWKEEALPKEACEIVTKSVKKIVEREYQRHAAYRRQNS